jgi:hypothetical protein
MNGSSSLLETSFAKGGVVATHISAVQDAIVYAGGLVGYNNLGDILDSYNQATVTGKNRYASGTDRVEIGGVAGHVDGATAAVLRTYSDTTVLVDIGTGGQTSTLSGSLIGQLVGIGAMVSSSFYNSTTNSLGGIDGVGSNAIGSIVSGTSGKVLNDMQNLTTFTGALLAWNLTDKWIMDTALVAMSNLQPILRGVGNGVITSSNSIKGSISPAGTKISANSITQTYTFIPTEGNGVSSITVNGTDLEGQELLDAVNTGYTFTGATGKNTIYVVFAFDGLITITTSLSTDQGSLVEDGTKTFIRITNMSNGAMWMYDLDDGEDITLRVTENTDIKIELINPTNHTTNYEDLNSLDPSSVISDTVIFALDTTSNEKVVDLKISKSAVGIIFNTDFS